MQSRQIFQKAHAALHNVPVSCCKISGIPRVRNGLPVPCFVLRKIQQKFYLVLRVRPGNAYGVPDIVCIGAEKVVIVEVIVLCDLPRPLAAKIGVWGVADVVFSEFLLRRRVDRVAPAVPDFLRAGGGGGDFKLVGYAAFLDEVLEDKLGDGGAA